jgi:hypothetical protein
MGRPEVVIGALEQARLLFPFSRHLRHGPSEASFVATRGLPPVVVEGVFSDRLSFDPHSADILLGWANYKAMLGQRDAGMIFALRAKQLIPSIELLEQPRVPPAGAAPNPSGGKENSK